MNYELEFFGFFLRTELQCYDPSQKITPKDFEAKVRLLSEETAAAKDRIMKDVLNLKRKDIKLFIQHHQKILIAFADQLPGIVGHQHLLSMSSIVSTPDRLNLSRRYYQSLEALLGFMEQFFGEHFEAEARLPLVYSLNTASQMVAQMAPIRTGLEKLNIKKQLIAIALRPLTLFTDDPGENKISFRKLIYFKEFIAELEALVEMPPAGVTPEDQLFNILCYMDLNTVKFRDYIIHLCQQAIDRADTIDEKLEKIRWMDKKVKQFKKRPDFILHTNESSLRDLIGNWLAQEAAFIKSENPRSNMQDDAAKGDTEDVIDTDLSISELACFARLMAETEHYRPKKAAVLIRVHSKAFRAKDGVVVHADTFRARMHAPSSATLEKVREYLRKMIDVSKRL